MNEHGTPTVVGEREAVVTKHPSATGTPELSRPLPNNFDEKHATSTPLLRNFTVDQPSLTLIILILYYTLGGLSSEIFV